MQYVVFRLAERYTLPDIGNMTTAAARVQLKHLHDYHMYQEMFTLGALKRNYLDKEDIGTDKYQAYLNQGKPVHRLTDDQRAKLLNRKPLYMS